MSRTFSKSRILSYLFLLTAATMMILGLSYAKYTREVKGTAAATVAVWGSESTSENIDITGLKPGDSKTFTLKVTNTMNNKVSEVTQDYTITLKITNNLPLTYTISGVSDPSSIGTLINIPNSLDLTDGSITLTGGSLPHTNTVTHTYTITVAWPIDENNKELADEIDAITLTVNAKQKQ